MKFLMVLFFTVLGYVLYNHLAYFLLIGWATLFYCGTPCAFHIIILHVTHVVAVLCG